MKFGTIDHIILFGGSRCLAEFASDVLRKGSYSLSVFTCDRQLEEAIYADGTTLEAFLNDLGIRFRSTPDINSDPEIESSITEATLGLGLGETWSFSRALIDRFGGRLLDLMGIRLPQYRGGAHYTWQILRNNRIGCCNLQVINEEMVQGEFDSGEIVKTREYFFPEGARIPNDYFEEAVKQEVAFLNEFLDEVESGEEFPLTRLQENFSIYFPRLYTQIHGFIDWSWDTEEIERFICAFDDPYAGASTFIDTRRVYLKGCYSEYNDGPFHPFQSGLIYKISNGAVFVASRSGTLVVKRILDEDGQDLLSGLKVGQRFLTPEKYLEEALSFAAVYTDQGLSKER